uniref:SCAN box domain-containing protein n=1 Tax=Crocodylus porosus TaxID=8502 RepID=A0A7M4FGG7_CROPO
GLASSILRRLDITPERHRQAFRDKKPAEVRTPCILWQTLADLLGKWLRPESTSKEQILDLVLMEQFINDLEEETRNWVRCHCPTSFREALQWAEQFDLLGGSSGGQVAQRCQSRRLGGQRTVSGIRKGVDKAPLVLPAGERDFFQRLAVSGWLESNHGPVMISDK